MVNREASFKLAPRPRSQSLLRRLGCLGGLCGLLLSGLLVVGLVGYLEFRKMKPNDLCLSEQELIRADKNKIVQPLFINETHFDVLMTVWSPSPNVNGSSHGRGKDRIGKDQVFWEGAVAKNISFHDESTRNFSLPLKDLNLTFLW